MAGELLKMGPDIFSDQSFSPATQIFHNKLIHKEIIPVFIQKVHSEVKRVELL
jgi:hypothetical protein